MRDQPGPGWTPPPGPSQPAWGPQQQYGGAGWGPPPPSRGSRLPLILGIVAVVIVVVGVIGALALLGSGFPGLGGGTALADVEVGQCFDGARVPVGTSTTVLNVELVDCAEPHESELIATFEYAGDSTDNTYPGDSELTTYAEDECLTRFTAYVGVTYYASSLEMSYLHPTSPSWLFGDRSIQCVAHPPAGQETMTGTVRDSRR